ncbi:MobC family plasmid mobilization relaxosome protein [Shewanella septentrionalis]|uniref:MobC family plasmid mobilization relaxosome protein n=1 Tax=Shewanella septentrionalis TaxID=2952223 RepID=A0A9X2WZ24_9GAMM|nr:MobC family plasmid mobilization relaxosome protein [Shewanella septentrionalis]MCT7948105.1 MobC family plasmid mobilization relaxosome protein [Shewanella septentrionalis]
MEKRTRVIKIRCTDAEYDTLVERSTKLRLAEWIRETCLGVPAKRAAPLPTVSPELQRQLTGIGNNLNQIARAVNRSQWSSIDKSRVITELVSIERRLAEIKKGHSNDC